MWVVFRLEVDFEFGGGPTAPSRKFGNPMASAGWCASCSRLCFSDVVFVDAVVCFTDGIRVEGVGLWICCPLLGHIMVEVPHYDTYADTVTTVGVSINEQ